MRDKPIAEAWVLRLDWNHAEAFQDVFLSGGHALLSQKLHGFGDGYLVVVVGRNQLEMLDWGRVDDAEAQTMSSSDLGPGDVDAPLPTQLREGQQQAETIALKGGYRPAFDETRQADQAVPRAAGQQEAIERVELMRRLT